MYGRDCLMIISLRRSDWCSEKGLTEMGLTSKSPRSLEEIWNPNPIRSDDLSVVVYTYYVHRSCIQGLPRRDELFNSYVYIDRLDAWFALNISCCSTPSLETLPHFVQ